MVNIATFTRGMYLWFEMNASKFDVNFDSFELILEVTLIQDNLYRLYMH
jgi:hypothetical protein